MGKTPSCHPLGPLLRLDGLDYAALPPNGASRDRIQQFMLALLQESLYLIGSVDTYYDNVNQRTNPSGWKSKGKQTYTGVSQIGGPGQVVVDLLERSIPKSELKAAIAMQAPGDDDANGGIPGINNAPLRDTNKTPTSETWACRRSFHHNECSAGTGAWEEFSVRMKNMHVETEKDMTPTVPSAQKLFSWVAAKLVNFLEVPNFEEAGPGPWTDFTLDMVEMEHDLKAGPLRNRVFPVLQMTCRTANEAIFPEIIVVSVPINGWKGAQLPQDIVREKLADQSKVVIGSYVSVERFRVVAKVDGPQPPTATKAVSKLSRVLNSLRGRKRPSLTPSAMSAQAAAATAATYPAEAPSSVPVPGAAGASGTTPAAAGQENVAPAQGLMQGPVGGGGNDDEIQPAPAVDAPNQNEIDEAESPQVNEVETQIEWTMATASHARGWLPLFLQTPAVPKKIAIDVPLFLKFLQSHRAAGAENAPVENVSQPANQQAANHPVANQPVANPPTGNTGSG
ncbi:hypothetical protein SCUCBS95973_004994 [Sporothrix curviconia]|uniref:DUF3074 domain-containing protein n=1 Tax=Sporothrix curviconia TaxID=1260050 RepID=A0ABP0BTF9_9PEZI